MGCCRCCCIILLLVVVVLGLLFGVFAGLFPYPSHASCIVKWQFGKPCSQVEGAIVKKIRDWSSNACNAKQQCGYEYLGKEGNMILGRRTVPVFKFTDSFNFTFDRSSFGCEVEGMSSSDAWYAIIDFGFNYCNMKNLVIGSHLDEGDPAYEEESSSSVCTMYNIAHCNLYNE